MDIKKIFQLNNFYKTVVVFTLLFIGCNSNQSYEEMQQND